MANMHVIYQDRSITPARETASGRFVFMATENKRKTMAFKKGESGNPGGRPKAEHRIQDLARARGPMALATLSRIARYGKSESARASAATALLDRGYGKPPQFTTGDNDKFRRAIEMSDDELASIASHASTGSNGASQAPVDPAKLN